VARKPRGDCAFACTRALLEAFAAKAGSQLRADLGAIQRAAIAAKVRRRRPNGELPYQRPEDAPRDGEAIVLVKKAAAPVNVELGLLKLE